MSWLPSFPTNSKVNDGRYLWKFAITDWQELQNGNSEYSRNLPRVSAVVNVLQCFRRHVETAFQGRPPGNSKTFASRQRR